MIGYYEGKIATFLFKQEDVPRFLKNTDPVGSVVPVYTHPAKTLTDDAIRYRWLRKEFGAGRETYLAECIPSEEYLDKYIDEQLRKAQEK